MFEKLIEMALSGVVGNFTYDKLKALLFGENDESAEIDEREAIDQSNNDSDIKAVYGDNIEYINRFKTFDIFHEFDELLPLVKDPVVHIVVEDKPSTAWHLPLVVLEDKTTKEWYIFSKGRMAFEGSGGGFLQSGILFKKLIDNKVPFTAWVLDYILTEKLSQGCRMWPEFRGHCIPLLIYNKNKTFTDYIRKTFINMSKP